MGVEFGIRGLPAGVSGALPGAGVSGDGGVVAMDGDAGDWGSGSTEALKASDIPPWAAIDTRADSTHNPMDFIATPLPVIPLSNTAGRCREPWNVATIVIQAITPFCAVSYMPR